MKKNQNEKSGVGSGAGRKVYGLVIAVLMMSFGWMLGSHWSQRASSTKEPASADVQPTSPVATLFGNSAGTSPQSFPKVASSAATLSREARKAESTRIARVTQDDHLEKRVEPIEALARRGDPGAVPAVLDALHDDDWRVRSRVMDAAVNAYVDIPETALIEHAQSDPSPEVRFLALAGIAARIDPAIAQVEAVDANTARAIGRQALSDASEHVRWQAQQILDTLDAKQSIANEQPQAEVL